MHHIHSNFLIYDYETFGINTKSDRPVQFASIRVNNKLHIIEKIQTFYCRIPNDYLPNPESILITGITPQFTMHYGLNESEFAYRIFNIFNNIPNTCIVGYNNIHFDDEFSRNIFYRNFCDPYSWSYKNGNSRWDLLPILRTFYSLYPEQIQWPTYSNDQISFRLTDIAHKNSIKHLNAHQAESDVYATLEIMKLLNSTQPQLFQFLYTHRTKYQLRKIINVDKINPILFISNKINNVHKNFINFLAPIAWHPTDSNILITYNLYNKISNLLNFNIETIDDYLTCNRLNIDKLFNKISLQLVRLNTCPILIPIHFLKKNCNISYNIKNILSNYQNCLHNLNLLRTNMDYKIYLKINQIFTIIKAYIIKKQMNHQIHVDNQLYHQFFNHQDQEIIKIIRNTNIEKLSTKNFKGQDFRLKSLLFFYRARNFPYTLNAEEQKKWNNHIKKKLFETKRYLNYIEQIDILLSYQNDLNKIKNLILLKEYYKYLHKITLM